MTKSASEPIFPITIAAELLTVHPRTLMLYEKDGLLTPARTETNRRRYSQKDLATVKFIQFLTRDRRVSLAGVKIIFEMLSDLEKLNLKAREQFFPDFKEDKRTIIV